MTISGEVPVPSQSYIKRATFAQEEHQINDFQHFTRLFLITMLDKLNRAKYLYDEATNTEQRQEADSMFADYYDWFTQQHIPIVYDQTIRRWLLAE